TFTGALSTSAVHLPDDNFSHDTMPAVREPVTLVDVPLSATLNPYKLNVTVVPQLPANPDPYPRTPPPTAPFPRPSNSVDCASVIFICRAPS
ncbi:hypothetical protein, partial [Salmonella enterica]|uniref:hypothetical protein n=1 Tax=Salmonella enterica TaxID=28901 RepID=UPI00398C37CF